MSDRDLSLLRCSLVLVWLGTALVSALGAHGRSAALLEDAGIHEPASTTLMLWGGIAFDVVIGLLLCFAPLRLSATIALAATLAMTVISTAVLPSAWLDPLGSLLKNLPIPAMLVVLRRNAP
jgi:ABC-type branched-subunit amino acid transport system permease subunit